MVNSLDKYLQEILEGNPGGIDEYMIPLGCLEKISGRYLKLFLKKFPSGIPRVIFGINTGGIFKRIFKIFFEDFLEDSPEGYLENLSRSPWWNAVEEVLVHSFAVFLEKSLKASWCNL